MTRIDRRTLLTGAAALGASTFAPPPLAALAAPAKAFPAVSAEAAALWALVAQNHEWHWQNTDRDAEVPEEFKPVFDATYGALWNIGSLDAEEAYALSRWALASDDPWFRELGLAIIERSRTLEGRRLGELLDIAEGLMSPDQPNAVRTTALDVASAHWDERPFLAADAMVNDADPDIRFDALQSVCWKWSDDRLAALAPLLRDPDPDVRAQVMWTAGRCFSDEDFDAMCEMVHDPEPEVRRHLALNLDREIPRCMDALITLTRDEDGGVRDCAMYMISSFDIDTPEVRAVLLAGLDDEDYTTRAEAALGLVRRRDPAGTKFIADDLRDDWCARATFDAAGLLAAPEFVADLLRHRDSDSCQDDSVRRRSLDWAISRCGGGEAAEYDWPPSFVPSPADPATPPAPDQRAA